jgi:hypothetical protein
LSGSRVNTRSTAKEIPLIRSERKSIRQFDAHLARYSHSVYRIFDGGRRRRRY